MAGTNPNSFPWSVRSHVNQAYGTVPPVPIVVCGTDEPRMSPHPPPSLPETLRTIISRIMSFHGADGFEHTQFEAEIDVGGLRRPILTYAVLVTNPGNMSQAMKVVPRGERASSAGGAWTCMALIDDQGRPSAHKHMYFATGPNPANTEPRADWVDPQKVIRVCVRSGIQVTAGGTTHPRVGADPEEIFEKRFHDLYSGPGQNITFEGITPSAGNENPVRLTRGFGGASMGISRSSTADRNRHELSRMGAAYASVAEAYGMAEGGWDALNTYDGPKLSFGWAQLTFGPQPSRATTPAGGWGKNFMAYLRTVHPQTFDECFGRYGYRITWSGSPGVYSISGTASDSIKFWRLPCHDPQGYPAQPPPANHVYIPPDRWIVQRQHTASVGFVALMVQAFRHGGFNSAMRGFIEGMIDSAAGTGNRSIREVARRLRDNVIRPGVGYTIHADTPGQAGDPRWTQPFAPAVAQGQASIPG